MPDSERIDTARLALTRPSREDIPAITQACQDPEIQRWTTIPSPYREADAQGFLTHVVEPGWASGASPTWAMREDGVLIGMVGLTDEGAGAGELGFWLAPQCRGRGLMVEAVGAVCAYGFANGLQRITWRALVGNFASAAVARRSGFSFEGTIRLGDVRRGERFDSWIAGLLTGDDRSRSGATWPAETFLT